MIVTERLCLRPFGPDDLPAFVAYRSRPDVARYQSWDTTFSLADAERFLASQQEVALGQQAEWVQLAAVDRVSGELCGDAPGRGRLVQGRMDHAAHLRGPAPRVVPLSVALTLPGR